MVHDPQSLGEFVGGQVGPTVGQQVFQGGWCGGIPGDDHGDTNLTQHGVGARYHGHLLDPRVCAEHGLYFQRVHVVAAPDEHLPDAAG